MTLALLFPGQGSQRQGMGADVFEAFPELVAAADEILGYSIRELCLTGGTRLYQTEYAQPALYVVSALTYLQRRDRGRAPSFLAGHSLGELSALFAAGCFDFETGLRLVRRRGELMSQIQGGGMVAVLGVPPQRLLALLEQAGVDGVEVANHNTPEQVVLAGPREAARAVADVLAAAGVGKCVPLNVNVAAHSRYMAPAALEFTEVLRGVRFAEPSVPVIANVTARPHAAQTMAELLSRHLCSPVRWWDTLCLLAAQGVDEVEEIGPGEVLSKMWRKARLYLPAPTQPAAAVAPDPVAARPAVATARPNRACVGPEALGSAELRRDYRTRYAYLVGAMGSGVSGPELLVRVARAGLLGFLGTAGRSLSEVETDLRAVAASAGVAGRYGLNLPSGLDQQERALDLVELGLRHGVRHAEVTGYAGVAPALVRWRFTGVRRDRHGGFVAGRHLLVKVSRVELAEAFMRPAPAEMVERLRHAGQLTDEEAQAARRLPVSGEVCVEADSPWLSGGGSNATLLPAVLALRDELGARYGYHLPVRVGAAGGIGTPEAVAAAFLVGADFVLTGSVNQCSPQARTSPAVKELLSTLDVDDTVHAPAGELFELGGRGQVVRRGTLFAARAETLYQAYRSHRSIEQINERTRRRFEESFFRRSVDEIWAQTRRRLLAGRPADLDRAERDPKHRMALVFRWYFEHATRLALDGVPDERLNYQIPCGPAVGAFNRSVAGTPLADWRNRHVETIAERLLRGAAGLLGDRLLQLGAAGAAPREERPDRIAHS